MPTDGPLGDQRPVAGPPPPNYPRQARGWPYVGRRRYCAFPRRALIAWGLAIVAFFGGGLVLAKCVSTHSAKHATHSISRYVAEPRAGLSAWTDGRRTRTLPVYGDTYVRMPW